MTKRIRKEELEKVVEETLGKLGRYGRWQLSMYFLMCMSFNLSGTWHMLSIVFTGGEPQSYKCKGSLNGNKSSSNALGKQCGTNLSVPCTGGWSYESDFGKTIITEWDLVCEKNFLPELSQTVFNGGAILGAVVFSPISDAMGRKSIHLLCQWAGIAVGVASAFSTSFISFTVGRFFQGFLREGMVLSGIIYVCELFPESSRSIAGISMQFFWSFAWMLLALIAYFIRDWRQLQLAISIPTVFTVLYIWLLSESVPWLLVKGRLDRAEKILSRAWRCNGMSLSDGPVLVCEDHQLEDSTGDQYPPDQTGAQYLSEDDLRVSHKPACWCCRRKHIKNKSTKKSETCLDIFHAPLLLRSAVIMSFLWFVNLVVYYGLSLSSSQLVGNPYLNFFLSGTVELPAYLITAVTVHICGRRLPLFVFHIIAASALLIIIFIPDSDFGWLKTIFWMVGKFGITASLAVLVLYAAEIYPTGMRNTGIGVAIACGKIGSILAPFTSYLGKRISWVPSVLFGTLALVAALLGLLLPETKGRPMPQTVRDVELWQVDICPCKSTQRSDTKIHDNSLQRDKKRSLLRNPFINRNSDTQQLYQSRPLTSILKYSSADMLNSGYCGTYKETTI